MEWKDYSIFFLLAPRNTFTSLHFTRCCLLCCMLLLLDAGTNATFYGCVLTAL